MEHHVVAVKLAQATNCGQCGPTTPHNVIVKCSCGQTATGKDPHIWTITSRKHNRVSFMPSFDWQEGEGSHLHEFLNDVPIDAKGQW